MFKAKVQLERRLRCIKRRKNGDEGRACDRTLWPKVWVEACSDRIRVNIRYGVSLPTSNGTWRAIWYAQRIFVRILWLYVRTESLYYTVTDLFTLAITVWTQTGVKERAEHWRVLLAPVIKRFESAVTGRACKTNMTLWLGCSSVPKFKRLLRQAA